MLNWIILGIAIIIFGMMFNKLRTEKKDTSKGPFDLSARPEVGTTDVTQTLLSKSNTGTLQAFVYPMQASKTPMTTPCNADGMNTPGLPDCSTGRFTVCECDANDCSRCYHVGYVNVLNISNIVRLELLAAPDASRPNAASTQLIVRTNGMANNVQKVFEETIPLPNLLMQKWTCVTIGREGRRFDVYYNGKLVASKRTQYTVDTRTAVGPILAGDPKLIGKVALVEAYPEKLAASTILEKYKANSDTTGAPNVMNQLDIFQFIPNCEGGNCNQGPSMRPTSPLQDWQTRYA
jgi:hypothetical protein